ncbi:MAG: FtsX-like permease family protein [Lachnospiraceae bacterium]|nr:FtsX-like permease family protein [Lachnospiraceae bacterium]
MMKKTTLREIRQSFGRYLAIFAIVAMGVGFFAGLKITRQVMITSANAYLEEKQLYDFRLLSTLGFEDEDVQTLSSKEDVRFVEGAVAADILYFNQQGNEDVIKAHSLLQNINGLEVVAGRLPQQATECVVDANLYDKSALGTKIVLSENNVEEDLDYFAYREYTIVGIAQSSAYIQFERGTTALGNGQVSGFMYLLPQGFCAEFYTEIYVKFNQDYPIYSKDYNDYIDEKEPLWKDYCKAQGERRYQAIVADAEAELANAKQTLAEEKADAKQTLADAKKELTDAEAELADAHAELADGWAKYNDSYAEFEEKIAEAEQEIADAEADIANIEKPETYVLNRDTNIGYACFQNDSSIVEGLANVFPVFFFLVAALVCMTTMNRMVEEQRTQIGVLKALGYGEAAIMGKYLFYSGSAALAGCIAGYFLGIHLFPFVIWTAYGMMYQMGSIVYIFDGGTALLCLACALLCSMGTTWISCRHELKEAAADLMRPKAPRAGKRVFLEWLPFIWKRLKFLHKVSVRNIVRYKRRFFMMVIGISGCTALLVTGFGIRDSVVDIADQQFQEIQTYQFGITLKNGIKDANDPSLTEFTEILDTYGGSFLPVLETTMDLQTPENLKSIHLIIVENPAQIGEYIDLHTPDKTAISYPKAGEAVICEKLAKRYRIQIGDTIHLFEENGKEVQAVVSGICENYIYNYIYLNAETYQTALGTFLYKNVYANITKDADIHAIGAAIMKANNITAVSINADMLVRFSSMMSSMNYIVFVVIACAAALAFIVLYNLNNINITERIREIATIKVLGFYRNETAAYVFRENTALTAIGCAVGLLLGKLLHIYVMHKVDIDLMSFDVHVKAVSYLLSILLTFAFTWIVNRIMTGKLENINMAESLKSVD